MLDRSNTVSTILWRDVFERKQTVLYRVILDHLKVLVWCGLVTIYEMVYKRWSIVVGSVDPL